MIKDKKAEMIHHGGGPVGFVLFVAWFGAFVYFINHAHGFWEVMFSFVQAFIWPALVLYRVLELLAIH
ncbi:MAG TPA: hypothetical protein VLG09_01710 [Candidatus Saccharimonadales bacterium]|nr:hypothetical protein [Candidatus Saccharimonadales bacterium]